MAESATLLVHSRTQQSTSLRFELQKRELRKIYEDFVTLMLRKNANLRIILPFTAQSIRSEIYLREIGRIFHKNTQF